MSTRAIHRLLVVYAVALFVACIALRSYVSLATPDSPVVVESWWKDGKRIARYVDKKDRPPPPAGVTAVEESVTGDAPLGIGLPLFMFALVPGLDGVRADLDGKTAYATVDDLLSVQAYDRGTTFMDPTLGVGTHRPMVLHVLAEQLGVKPSDLAARGRFRRVRFERRPLEAARERITTGNVRPDVVREGLREAARYLARSVDEGGRYRYLVDAPTNTTVSGYNWPRHSGATFFLAQAAAALDDPEIRYACLRAASRLRDDTMTTCGDHRCISSDVWADVGSSALALIAFSEIVRTGADGSYRPAAVALAEFLRSQQRPDGELMHLYDRTVSKPVDVQYLYYTGEAALALSRAHLITDDPRDLDAASRALGRLSGEGWSFFGSRYYFSEEHWTCQAVSDLWERAPNPEALRFCLRWHEYQRRLQHEEGDSPYDAEGSFGVGPLISPRVTPASSRGEAAAAALDVLLREQAAGRSSFNDQIAPLEFELRRALAFILRHQLLPGPTHLFAAPEAVRGAFPGSPVDWQLRIDFAQHAGSMMVRWLEVSRRNDTSSQP